MVLRIGVCRKKPSEIWTKMKIRVSGSIALIVFGILGTAIALIVFGILGTVALV